MSILSIVLIVTLACCLIMAITWLAAIWIDNFSIVDVVWSYNFPIIAAILYFLADGAEARKLMVLFAVCCWGFRLGSHLMVRIAGHIHTEDGRYLELRKKWSKNLNREFFQFYQMQAISNVFLAIPFFIMMVNPSPELTQLEKIGFIIWAIALAGEALSDYQLARFKKNPANKGQVCNVGLWSWSRHPNYFFEFLIWVAYATMALSSPWGWLAIICPVSIFYLLHKVTGIPMTEEQAVRSKGELYINYQKTTSKFFPFPPRRIKN